MTFTILSIISSLLTIIISYYCLSFIFWGTNIIENTNSSVVSGFEIIGGIAAILVGLGIIGIPIIITTVLIILTVMLYKKK